MKPLCIIAAVIAVTGLFASCKRSDDASPSPYGKLQVSFANEVDGKPIALGPLSYVNAASNTYSVDLLKYYITNVTLVKADSTERNFKNYQLIDAANSASQTFTLDSVANGDYIAVKFYLGVDTAHNHHGAQDGALDPVNGMIWDWNTGYMFFKHEGNFKDASGATKPITFHYGTDDALCTIKIDIPKLTVTGNTRKVNLKFNLNSAYGARSMIDFNVDNLHESTSTSDFVWINKMSANLSASFSYGSEE